VIKQQKTKIMIKNAMQCNNKNKNNMLIKYALYMQNTQTGLILYTDS